MVHLLHSNRTYSITHNLAIFLRQSCNSIVTTPYLFRSNWYIGLCNKILACVPGLNAHGYNFSRGHSRKDRLESFREIKADA